MMHNMNGVGGTNLLLLDRQLCFSLYAAQKAMTAAYQPILAELGLTYPQYLAMLVLWEEGEASVSRLGERLKLDSGTLTPLLKRLEKAGLVTRRRSEDDERVVLVSLTAEGKRMKGKAEKVPLKMFCNLGTSTQEFEALKESLDRLTRSLEGSGA